MKPLKLHIGAEIDLCDALKYYESQRVGLGGEFRREFEKTIERIRHNPEGGAYRNQSGVRFRTLQRFPYSLVYFDLRELIWIVAVAHHSRHPSYWLGRKAQG